MHALYHKGQTGSGRCGESWDVSTLDGNMSVVSNGFLKGNELGELIEVYMGDLVGDSVFGIHGTSLPILVKLIDSTTPLSIQVHPGDQDARGERQGGGKSELWYVMAADPGAQIHVGFNRDLDAPGFLRELERKTLSQVLNAEPAVPGDVFYIPAGRIHAIGGGVTLCEIQQPADTTYRVYDWDRVGLDGKPRELHLGDALEVLDFGGQPSGKTSYQVRENASVCLHASPPFTTNLICFDRKISSDLYYLDSFVVYVCVEGACSLHYPGGSETLRQGETLMLPAEIKTFDLVPEGTCRILETYIS